MRSYTKHYLPEDFNGTLRDTLHNFHITFSTVLSTEYACAITVNPNIRRDSSSSNRLAKGIGGVDMQELFVNGFQEVKITTYGNPKNTFGIRPFERVKYSDVYQMSVNYKNLSLEEIKAIEDHIGFVFTRAR